MSTTISMALRKIKKLKGSIATHTQRVHTSVSYVKGKEPAFRFQAELDVLRGEQCELIALEAGVAKANATTMVSFKLSDFGEFKISLAQAIRELQEIKGQISLLQGLNLRNEVVEERHMDYTDDGKPVYRIKEIIWVSDLSETDREQQVKALENRFEELNNGVESANHVTEI